MVWSRSSRFTCLVLMVLILLVPFNALAQLEEEVIIDEDQWEEIEIDTEEWEEYEETVLDEEEDITEEYWDSPEITSAEESAETERLRPLENSQEKWESVVGNTRFEEKDEEIEEEKSPLQTPDINPDLGFMASGLFKAIVVLAIVALLVFIIIQLSKSDMTVNKKVDELDVEMVDEAERNIQESDLERLLRLALEGKDYRMALRVRYLMILKELDGRGWISHSPEKTNINYLMELSERPESSRFADLTNIFEYVWYAEIQIPERDDALFAREFGGFLNEISRSGEE